MKVSLTETYRPQRLEDVVEQDHVTSYILGKIKANEPLPHLLFHGMAGVGKTTIAQLIPNELHDRVLTVKEKKVFFKYINASDENNVDTVRKKIKDFTRMKVNYAGEQIRSIIFLDEMDAMSKEAQYSLRAIIEKNEENCQFILSFNFINKVIDAIQSRCNCFRFKPITQESILQTIKAISDHNNFKVKDEILQNISIACNGDMRRSLRLLETARFSPKAIDTSYVPDEVFGPIYDMIQKVPYEKTVNFVMLKMYQGYQYQEFVNVFIDKIMYDKKLSKKVKISTIHKLGSYYIASSGNYDLKGMVNITIAFMYSKLKKED